MRPRRRGRVYLRVDDRLVVPTPYQPLHVVLSSSTEIEDGIPAPGAEIRAEGWLRDENEVVAERVKVLCRAPAPLSDDEIPPEAEPVQPEASDNQ